MEEKELLVKFPGGMRVDVQYKGYLISTDQPAYAGGEGTAPSPFDLFLISIAACAGFYVLAFLRERGLPTDNAGVVMRTARNPETKMIEKINLDIQLPSGFPEKYRNAVVKAVDACTVKAHILKPPAFEIVVKDDRP